jgi:hypothetical protein
VLVPMLSNPGLLAISVVAVWVAVAIPFIS